LIVQCNQCEAKYRIADEKITGQGVRVRCAKCDNVFTVKPPPPAEKTPAETPAPPDETTGDPGSGGEDPLTEPPPPPPPDDPAPEQKPEQKKVTEDPAPEEEPGQRLPEGLGDFSGPGGEPGSDTTPSERESFDSDLSDPDGLSGQESNPPEEEKISLPDLADEDQALGRPEGDFIKQDLNPDEPYQAPVQLSDEPATDGPGMDWGNIALDSSRDEERTDADMGLAPPSPFGAPEPDTGPSMDAALAPPVPPWEESQAPPRETTTASRAAAPSSPAKKGSKGLVFLLVIALLAGGGYFLYPKALQLLESRSPAEEGTLIVQDIVVGTVKQQGGNLLAVVRGKIRNDSSASKGMIQVQGTFKGPGGRALAESTSFCGNTFTDGELAASDLESIRQALANELGQSLSNSSLKPGDTVPFLIVLENPPNQIKEVTVTVKKWSSTT